MPNDPSSRPPFSKLKTVGILGLLAMFVLLPMVGGVLLIWFFQGSAAASGLAAVFGFSIAVGLTLAVLEWVIDLAASGQGRVSKVVGFLHGVCILFLCLIGSYVVIHGSFRLWHESWRVAVLAIGALVFVLYYGFKRQIARRAEVQTDARI